MANLNSAAPTFLVDDVAKTARWYAEHLGFKASFAPKMEPYFYASLQRDGVEIMLLRLAEYKKPVIERTGGAWDAYIRVKGVRDLYETVSRSTPIKSPLAQQTYGDWEFEIADPNGYVLVFSE